MSSSFSIDKKENRLNIRVPQTAHGFILGDVLRADSGQYVKAQANSDANAEVVGIVSEIIDANTFKLRLQGKEPNISGLTPNTTYFLSATTPGAVVTVDPASLTSGHVSKPVYVGGDDGKAIITNFRGINDGSNSTGELLLNGMSDVTLTSPADGQVLTYDSGTGQWINEAAAGGGGGAWTLISTSTPSAAHPVTFTGLNSTYYAYKLVFDNCTVSNDASSMYLRTSTDDTNYDGGASDYQYEITGARSDGGVANSRAAANASIIMHGDVIGNAANETFGGNIVIMNPSSSSYTKIFLDMHFNNNNGLLVDVRGWGERLSTTPVTAISLNLFAGTFTGTFKLYGLSAT